MKVIVSIVLEIEILSLEVTECDEVVEDCQEMIHDLSTSFISSSSSSSSECHLHTTDQVHHLEHLEHVFAFCSIAILCVFVVENVSLIIAKP